MIKNNIRLESFLKICPTELNSKNGNCVIFSRKTVVKLTWTEGCDTCPYFEAHVFNKISLSSNNNSSHGCLRIKFSYSCQSNLYHMNEQIICEENILNLSDSSLCLIQMVYSNISRKSVKYVKTEIKSCLLFFEIKLLSMQHAE